MKDKVQAAIARIRPMLQRDGGDVELVDVQEGVVTVRLRRLPHVADDHQERY